MAKNGYPFHFFFSPLGSVLTMSGPRGTFSTHSPASSSHLPSPFWQSSGVWNEPNSRRLFATVEPGNNFLLLTSSLSYQSYHGAIGGAWIPTSFDTPGWARKFATI